MVDSVAPEPRVRAVVIGASGFVGGSLLHVLRQAGTPALGTYCRDRNPGLVALDFCDERAVRELLDTAQPETVFCPAARPAVDWCESHPMESTRINVMGARNVAAACAERGVALVFFSSDYIFDGTAGPYAEGDRPRPVNVYGHHKWVAEEQVRSLLPDRHVIIRTTVVYGWEPRNKNYAVNVIDSLRERRRIRAPKDQIGTPTYCPNLAVAAVELAERQLYGTWHVAGPERMSRYLFACLVAGAFGLDASLVEGVATEELHQTAPRPLAAGLTVKRAAETLRTRLLGTFDGLRQMRDGETRAAERTT